MDCSDQSPIGLLDLKREAMDVSRKNALDCPGHSPIGFPHLQSEAIGVSGENKAIAYYLRRYRDPQLDTQADWSPRDQSDRKDVRDE